MATEQTINEVDLQLILFTDNVQEAVHHIKKHAINAFNLKAKITKKPIWLLGEKAIVSKK